MILFTLCNNTISRTLPTFGAGHCLLAALSIMTPQMNRYQLHDSQITSTVAIDMLDCALFYPTPNLVSFTLSGLFLHRLHTLAYNSLSDSSVSLSEVGWFFLISLGLRFFVTDSLLKLFSTSMTTNQFFTTPFPICAFSDRWSRKAGLNLDILRV